MKTTLTAILGLALLGACSLDTTGELGPDAGDEVPQLADPDEIAWCIGSSKDPHVRLVSRTLTSLTVDVDINDPTCRWLVSSWELWEANLPDFPYLSDYLASGDSGDLPFRYTHAGLLPGKRYCLAARTNGGTNWSGDCFYTEALKIKKWW